MNEQAIQDSYNLFVQQGYKKSIDDFKQLIATNPDALNDSYSLFQQEGYNKSIEDYKNLMGVGAQPTLKKKEPTTMASPLEDTSSDLSSEQKFNPFAQNTVGIPQPAKTVAVEETIQPTTGLATAPTETITETITPVKSKKQELEDILKNVKITEEVPVIKPFDKETEKILSEGPKSKRTSLASNYSDNLALGLGTLSKMVVSIPEGVYNIFAAPQNAVAWATGVDIATNADQFGKNLGIENPVLKALNREQELTSKRIETFNKENYESSSIYENITKGNYGDAFELMGAGIIQNAPVSVAMMYGGTALTSAELTAAGTATFFQGNYEELGKENPNMPEIEKTIKGLGMAGAESFFRVLGEVPIGQVYKSIIAKEGFEAGKSIFKNGLVQAYKAALKKYGAPIGLLGEGLEEAATQVTQNMISGKEATEGVADAFILGAGSGATFAAPLTAAQGIQKVQNLTKDYQAKSTINTILKDKDVELTQVYNVPKADKITPEQIDIANTDRSRDILRKNLLSQLRSGAITKADAKQSLYVFDKVQQVSNSVKDLNVSSTEKAEVANLLSERNELNTLIQNKEPILAVKEKERINEIENQIVDVILKSTFAQDAVAEKVKNESAKDAAKRTKRIAEIETALSPENTVVLEPAETQKLKQELQTLKIEEDAIQKQITDESLLRGEQPEVGLQEVVEGNAQPKGPTGGTTEVTDAKPQEKVSFSLDKIKKEGVNGQYYSGSLDELIFLDPKDLRGLNDDEEIAAYRNKQESKKENNWTDKQWAESILDVPTSEYPIMATLAPDGKIKITDGHHRQLAAIILNKNLAVQLKVDNYVDEKGKPTLLEYLNSKVKEPEVSSKTLPTEAVVDEQKAIEDIYNETFGITPEEVTPEEEVPTPRIEMPPMEVTPTEEVAPIEGVTPTEVTAPIEVTAPTQQVLTPQEKKKRASAASTNKKLIQNTLKSLKSVFPDLPVKLFDTKVAAKKYLKANGYNQATADRVRATALFKGATPFAIVGLNGEMQNTTLPHEVWHVLLAKAFTINQNKKLFKDFRKAIEKTLIENGNEQIVKDISAFADQAYYKRKNDSDEEFLVELGAYLTVSGFKINELNPKQKTILNQIKDIINKFAQKIFNAPIFLADATPNDVLSFLVEMSDSMRRGEDLNKYFEQGKAPIAEKRGNVLRGKITGKESKISNENRDKAIKVARTMGMNDKGFFGKNSNPSQLNNMLSQYGYGVKQARVTADGFGGGYFLVDEQGRKAINTLTSKSQIPMVFETKDGLPYKSEVKGDYPIEDKNVKEGDVKTLEEVWSKVKDIKFSGDTKIKSHADVAFIMKTLESKGVEHAFAVHIDESNTPHIQFLGIGGVTAAVVDARIVTTGAKRYKAKTTYLIHNHPSGNLKPSNADFRLTERIQEGFKGLGIELEHIIIDTYKEQYTVLKQGDTFESFQREKEATGKEKPYKVEKMDSNKVLSKPIGRVFDSSDVIEKIQQMRFSALPKKGIFILNSANDIIANIMVDNFEYKTIVDAMIDTPTAVSIIAYGNSDTATEKAIIRDLRNELPLLEVRLLDFVQTSSNTEGIIDYYKSWESEGLLGEVQSKYETNSVVSSKEQVSDLSKAIKFVEKARAQGLSEANIKTFLESKDFSADEIEEAMSPDVEASSRIKLTEDLLPGIESLMNRVDGLIETAKNDGLSKKDQLADVLKRIEKIPTYKNATDVQRERIIKDIEKKIGITQKRAPSVDTILGVIQDVKKITMTEKQLLIEQLKNKIKGAKDAISAYKQAAVLIAQEIKDLVKSGTITARQGGFIVSKFAKVNMLSPKSISKFVDYMGKVFADAEYDAQLGTAKGLRSDIKKLSKNKDKNADFRKLAQEFINIDPSMVEDIYAYNEMASQIKSSVKGSTLRGKDTKFSDIVSIQDATRYISDTLRVQDKKILEEQRAEVQELMDIDASEMTPEQLKILLEGEGEAKVTKYNESIVRSLLDKAFKAYSGVINEILKTNYDAFYTGEKVELTKNQKTLIKQFMDMDLTVLTPKESLQAVDALANFIQNQSTAKMETIVSDYTGRLNARKLAASGVKAQPLMKYFSKGFGKFLAEQTTTLPILFEKMFKGFNRSGKVQDMMGVTKLINGKSLAQNLSNIIVNDYVRQFFNKTANGEAFNTDYNNVERGMASFMMRNIIGTEQEMQAEFNRRKNLIEESIDVLSKGNDIEKQKAALYQKVYDKIVKDSKTIQEIKNKTDETNLEAIDFWRNQWSDKYEELSDVSENVYNKILEKDINYSSPDRFAKISSDTGEVDLANDESAFHNNNGTIYKKETGVLMKATKPETLPTNKKNGKPTSYIELSFDKNNSNSMYDALVDMKTASAIRQIEAFENSADFEKIVPTADDAKILKDRVQLYVRNIRNKNPYSDDQLSKAVRRLNRLAAFGVSQALSGVGQPIKQVIPVLTNTLINAGSIDIMSSFNAAKQKFMSESGYGISNRGVESQAQIESLNKLIDTVSKNNFDKSIKAIEKINQKYLELFLVNPDVFIARASWMTYYENSLKEQGIDPNGIDYNTHELNEKAANYAQRMVDRQQNISDVDLSGKLFASKESSNQVLVKMLMPFASFRMNQSARLSADLATLSDKTASAEDKKIAAKSVAGFGVELATFKMISAGIAITLGTLTKALMGQDEDEEEKDKRMNDVIKGQWTGTITDIISPIPVVDKPIQAAVETVSTLLEEGTGLPISTFGASKSDWTSNLGTFGISVQRATELYDMTKLATTGKYTDDFNKEHTISEESQSQITKLLPFAMLSNMGLAPAEVNTVVKNAVKYAKKNTKSPEEKQQAEENKEDRESTKEEKISALETIIEESNDEAIIKEAKDKIDEVDADKEEKKIIKQENAEEKQAKKKLLVDPNTGEEYDTETDLKRYNRDLWEQNFGEGSDWYESHKEEKEVESLLRKKVQQMKDEEMNYTGRNSDGSKKRFGASGTKKAQRFGSSSKGKVKRFGS